jgi:hypothetical protein
MIALETNAVLSKHWTWNVFASAYKARIILLSNYGHGGRKWLLCQCWQQQ